MTAPERTPLGLEHELAHELYSGPLGTCWLGQITAGHELGRAVMVRRVQGLGLLTRSITEAARRATLVSHPAFVKVLGGVELSGEVRVVSEELRAVSLRELPLRLLESGAVVPPPVAVRVVCDALSAVSALRARLGKSPGDRCGKALLPDTTVIAEFGETLLADVVVGGALVAALRPRADPELFRYLSPEELEPSIRPGDVYEGSEVWTAGVILWELLTGRPLKDPARAPAPPLDQMERLGLPVPSALARMVERALDRSAERRPQTTALFAAELSGLGPRLCASNQAVQQFIEPLLPRRASQPSDGSWQGQTPWGKPMSAVRQAARALVSQSASAGPPSEAPTLRPPAPAAPRRRRRRAGFAVVLGLGLLAAALLGWLLVRAAQKIQYRSSSGTSSGWPTTKFTPGTL